MGGSTGLAPAGPGLALGGLLHGELRRGASDGALGAQAGSPHTPFRNHQDERLSGAPPPGQPAGRPGSCEGRALSWPEPRAP